MLSQVMGGANLTIWAEAALVIFMAIFVGAVFWVMAPSRQEELDAAAQLPLDD